MVLIHGILSVFLITICYLNDVVSLKNVKLSIVPAIVQYLNDSTLRCSYDLEDDILYSVKWYRGLLEFYRYTPSELPNTKVFPFEGITVDVSSYADMFATIREYSIAFLTQEQIIVILNPELSKQTKISRKIAPVLEENSSNSTQVVLRNIEFNLSGNFSCEVTTDLPHMIIGVDEQNMMVIQLPESSPKISVGREVLNSGDILRANCSSPPSRPPVKLLFKLNNLTVAQNNPHPYTKLHERSWSDLSLDLPLDDLHFDNGRLVLHCIAVLPGILHDEVQLELESAKNPVPQRVSGLNGVKKASVQTKLPYILLCYFLFQSAIVGVV